MFGPLIKSFRKRFATVAVLVAIGSLLSLSCEQPRSSRSDVFYAQPVAPRKQEFRWSNGKAPKSFDPALASTPPETDIVRGIYEGLTDLDPHSLREIPAAAEKWSSSPDFKVWTFRIRKDAKWSNGEPLTAGDFVRSWKRLMDLGDRTANRGLLDNILGAHKKIETPPSERKNDELKEVPGEHEPIVTQALTRTSQVVRDENSTVVPRKEISAEEPQKHLEHRPDEERLGVEAVGDLVFKVTLATPDKDFPKLAANPIFRPVYGDGKYFDANATSVDIVTNGPFRITAADQGGVVLGPSDKYWDRGSVTLESVHIVPELSAEKALEAYRAGDVDAVTNADFEPLLLKLLSPYTDFRQATHNALNFYEVNTSRSPFSDRRIREALAISIERAQLSESEMKGSTEPAFHFLPYDADVKNKLLQDTDRARELLTSAGFPNGAGFPVIRLVVNRNDTQLRIARSVMRMWKQNLNLSAELTVKETSEMDAVRSSGDFDVIRRGVVFPSVDKKMSFAALFPDQLKAEAAKAEPAKMPVSIDSQTTRTGGPADVIEDVEGADVPNPTAADVSDDTAVFDFRIIPLYFSVSYGLVKPYVQGFDLNGLDAPSLKEVKIDSNWSPDPSK